MSAAAPLVFAAAAALGLAATVLARAVALRLGVVAPTNPIVAQHVRPIPYLGGAAAFAAAACALALAKALGVDGAAAPLASARIALPAAAFLVLGTVDDARPLRVAPKLALQVAIAIAAVALGLGDGIAGGRLAGRVAAAFAIVAMVNAVNVIDVCDGVAAGCAAVAFAAAGAVDPALTVAGAAVAGACAGFVILNLPPARIFLGDGGSHLLGFLTAAFALSSRPAALPAWGLLFGVFLFEFAFISAMRISRGIPPWRGSGDHISLRLRAAGVARPRVAMAHWCAGAALAACAAAFVRVGAAGHAALLAFVAVVGAIAAWRLARLPLPGDLVRRPAAESGG